MLPDAISNGAGDHSPAGQVAIFLPLTSGRTPSKLNSRTQPIRFKEQGMSKVKQAAAIMGTKGGKKKSKRKAAASRRNGKLGGRPKKTATEKRP